jgi:hypothetical protein
MTIEYELRPSWQIWKYFNGVQITPLLVVSSCADRLGGYHISYSAEELLKDLGLVTDKGAINKRGRELIAAYLHEKYHKSFGCDPVKIIPPTESEAK